uniref:Uncharacterized protein n=1 Tax=Arundo donax TaxID=35708 RepID=A0A0A9EKY3_ARUDO
MSTLLCHIGRAGVPLDTAAPSAALRFEPTASAEDITTFSSTSSTSPPKIPYSQRPPFTPATSSAPLRVARPPSA